MHFGKLVRNYPVYCFGNSDIGQIYKRNAQMFYSKLSQIGIGNDIFFKQCVNKRDTCILCKFNYCIKLGSVTTKELTSISCTTSSGRIIEQIRRKTRSTVYLS